jgi:hypothetical protein
MEREAMTGGFRRDFGLGVVARRASAGSIAVSKSAAVYHFVAEIISGDAVLVVVSVPINKERAFSIIQVQLTSPV